MPTLERRRVKRVSAYILVGVAAILAFTLLQFVLAIMPIKYRSAATPQEYGAPYEPVSFATEDGKTLRGWFVPANQSTNRTLLVGHGYPFDKGNVLPAVLFLREEFNLFLFDFRSFGESEGRITTLGRREVRDVQAAVAYLSTRNDSQVLGAYGFSLSAATFLLAQPPQIQALVSDASYARLDLLAERQYFFLPGPLKYPFVWMTALYSRIFLGFWPSEVSPAQAIRTVPFPVLLVHGTRDSQIPVRHAEILYENAPKDRVELWLIEGADHGETLVAAGPEYEDRIRGFFRAHLAEPKPPRGP